jgi:magnesium-transporting ATPase (P-type)
MRGLLGQSALSLKLFDIVLILYGFCDYMYISKKQPSLWKGETIMKNQPAELAQRTENRRGFGWIILFCVLLALCFAAVGVVIYFSVTAEGHVVHAAPVLMTTSLVLIAALELVLPIIAFVQEHKVRDGEPKNWLMRFFSDSVPIGKF